MKREKVIEAVNGLPAEFSLDELVEKLILVEKVEQGLAQLKEGKVTPQEEVKDLVKKW